ncbi:MAG: hypothetical protein EBZ76_14355, partial [Synechococcaceae bacterium WB9_2_170]|nr:hypothetical protein [Synechococcaceae bacterium WB9_2_170]
MATASNRSAADGSELLDFRDIETADNNSAAEHNSTGSSCASDAAPPAGTEPANTSGGDGPSGAGLSEALKAERRRSNNLEKELRGLR